MIALALVVAVSFVVAAVCGFLAMCFMDVSDYAALGLLAAKAAMWVGVTAMVLLVLGTLGVRVSVGAT